MGCFSEKNISGIVTLEGIDLSNIPMAYDVVLVDAAYQTSVDLREASSYQITSSGREDLYPFVILVGLPDAVNQEMKTMGCIPDQFGLAQNTPNPFNPVTSIKLLLPEEAIVSLTVYNILGKEVKQIVSNQTMNSGTHRMIWNGLTHTGEKAPTGVYLYNASIRGISGKHFTKTRKMILIK